MIETKAAFHAVRINTFRPPQLKVEPTPRQIAKPALLATAQSTRRVGVEDPPVLLVPLDLNKMELQFADDISNQLPEVMRSHNGMFALLDKRDPTFARYLIAPPEWQARETLVDVSRKLHFSLTPPEKWKLLASAAQLNAIDLDDYRVCALFDSVFIACLQSAIRAKVLAQASFHGQAVQQARMAFDASNPCGVSVLGVTFGSREGKLE